MTKHETDALLWMIAGAVVNNAVALRRIEGRTFPERFREGAPVDVVEEHGRLSGATEEACSTRETFLMESDLRELIRREGGLPPI